MSSMKINMIEEPAKKTGQYKQTEVGMIPANWNPVLLGKLCSSISSGKSKTAGSTSGKFPIYGSTGQIGNSIKFDYNGQSILIARVGANAGVVNHVGGNYCVSDNTLIVSLSAGIQYRFIYYFLKYRNLNSLVFGSGQPLITGGQLKNLAIPLPPLSEQTAIAEALSDADAMIASLEKLIDKKTKIKQGAMQELLSSTGSDGKLKEGWVKRKLGEVAEIFGGGTPSTNVSEYWNGYINWFTPTEIGLTKYVFTSARRITQAGLSNSSARILPKGTLILTTRAGIGDISILGEVACTNQGFQSFIVNEETSSEFLYYLLIMMKEVFIQRASGSTFLEISPRVLKQIEIYIPSINIQLEISNILSVMDVELDVLYVKLNKAQKLKQGMMQNLLTGKIRLV